MDNPFYHRGPIRNSSYFCNRQQETEQITSLLRVSQSVSVVGPRRIGKTSLLYHLAATEVRATHGLPAPQFVIACLDAQGAGQSSLGEVYALFLNALWDALAKCPIEARPPAGFDSPDYHVLDATLKWLNQRGTSVAFFIDEFELLAANCNLDPSFFSGLRGLATRYSVSYLIASQRPLISLVYANDSVLSSPFFNIFMTMPLGAFDDREALGLLHTLLATAQAELPDAALQAALKLAGPHPFFLQMAAYHACELGQSASPWSEQTTTRLTELFYEEAYPHYLYAWRTLSEWERYTLANLAISQHDSSAAEAVHVLRQQALILPAGSEYHYISSSLQRFVRAQSVKELLQTGPFVIDLRQRTVTASQEALRLTKTQFDLLRCLAQREGQVVTTQELEQTVWRDEYVEDPERLKAAIKHLRRALGVWGEWVVNERGVGYALRAKGV